MGLQMLRISADQDLALLDDNRCGVIREATVVEGVQARLAKPRIRLPVGEISPDDDVVLVGLVAVVAALDRNDLPVRSEGEVAVAVAEIRRDAVLTEREVKGPGGLEAGEATPVSDQNITVAVTHGLADVLEAGNPPAVPESRVEYAVCTVPSDAKAARHQNVSVVIENEAFRIGIRTEFSNHRAAGAEGLIQRAVGVISRQCNARGPALNVARYQHFAVRLEDGQGSDVICREAVKVLYDLASIAEGRVQRGLGIGPCRPRGVRAVLVGGCGENREVAGAVGEGVLHRRGVPRHRLRRRPVAPVNRPARDSVGAGIARRQAKRIDASFVHRRGAADGQGGRHVGDVNGRRGDGAHRGKTVASAQANRDRTRTVQPDSRKRGVLQCLVATVTSDFAKNGVAVKVPLEADGVTVGIAA